MIKLFKQIPVTLGAALLLGGIAHAVEMKSSSVPQPLFLAELRDFCDNSESTFVSAETQGFWVNICGGDLPGYYVGVSKVDGKRIRLRLQNYDPQGNYFEAMNGDVSYLLIRGTAKGDFLTVTQGSRELVRQPILNWE
jgi:hypothetical protein